MAILKNTVIADTGFIQIPTGTAAQRPVSPVIGDFRYNSEEESFEVYNGEDWLAVGSSGGQQVFSGQQAFTTPGTFSWIAPIGVSSVSVVCVGGGGGGGTSYRATSGTVYISAWSDAGVNGNNRSSNPGTARGQISITAV